MPNPIYYLSGSAAIGFPSSAAPDAPPTTFNDAVDAITRGATGATSHFTLEDTTDRLGVGTMNALGAVETGLPAIESLSPSPAASRGFDGVSTRLVIDYDAAYDTAEGTILYIAQPDDVSVKQQLFTRGLGLAGSVTHETVPGGGLKCIRNWDDYGAGFDTLESAPGVLSAGTPVLIAETWGAGGHRLFALESSASLGLVASSARTDFTTYNDAAAKGCMGAYLNPLLDFYNGVAGHLVIFPFELTIEELQSLAVPQQVVWAADIDAGQVVASGTKLIDLAGKTHPDTGFTVTASQDPSDPLGTLSDSGEDLSYTADAATGMDEPTYTITFDGTESDPATVSILIVAEVAVPYTVPVVPAAAVGGEIYASQLGDDATGDGTIGNPYLTLAKCLSVVSNGGTIILRAGDFRTEQNLTVSATNVTVKGYAPDIETDPLDPDNWPIIDGCIDPASITWELFHAGRNEYRTTATNLGTANPECHAIAGTDPYQIPRWEPLGGRRVPTPVYRLYPYFGTTGARGSTSFRGGAPTGTQNWTCYHGPGVMRESDGRIHIRLEGVDDTYTVDGSSGTINKDPFSASLDPANHTLFIHERGKTLFSSIASGFSFEGIFVRGYNKFLWGSQSNVTIRRNVLWGCDYSFGLFQLQGTCNNWLFQHNVFEQGYTAWTPYQLVKQNLLGGFGYGQLVPIWGGSGSTTNAGFKFLDNLLPSSWACAYLPNASSASDIELAYNSACTRDDFDIWPPGVGKRHFHHNFIEGPTYGVGTATAAPSTFEFYSHHNVVVCNRMTLEFIQDRRGHGMCNKHNAASNMVIFEYHNTYVANQPDVYGTGMNMGRPFLGGYINNSSTPHRTFNNIFTWYVQVPPSGSSPSNRYVFHDFSPNDSNRKWFANGDGYWGVHGAGVTGSAVLFGCYPAARAANPEDFYASLAAWQASTPYANTSGTGWNFGGRKLEQDAIQADPQFAEANAITQDARYDHPPADYKPGNSAYHSGAIDITSFNWPDATVYEAWRGALDPAGDGSEIGPRTASE